MADRRRARRRRRALALPVRRLPAPRAWHVAVMATVLGAGVIAALLSQDDPSTTGTAAGGASPATGGGEPGSGGGAGNVAGTGTGDAAGEPSPAGDVAARVDAVLADLSVEQRVGQLLVAAVRGSHPTDVSDAAAAENAARFGVATPAEVVARHQLGGVIYFTYAGIDDPPDRAQSNLLTPAQTAELSRGLQRASREATGVGLLISTDQEHGFITRTPAPWTRLPGPMALAATRDWDLAESAARAAGDELAAVGINVALAPVADVNTEAANPVIGVRSPGASPQLVADVVAAQIRGLTAAGVGATAKHFPGHGSVDVDSHEALPVVDASAGDIRTTALPPFAAAIDAGVGGVMPGHLSVPALDDRPATVSPAIVDGLLRGELGFEGVVLTDALDMAAIAERDSPADVALQALRAGVDVLLMPPDLPAVRQQLIAAVEDGRLSRERLEASVRRVLTWKAELGLLADDAAAAPEPDQAVGTDEHAELAAEVAGAAVTAVEAACGVLPVSRDQRVAVVGPGVGGADQLAAALQQRGATVTTVTTGLAPSASRIARARRLAAEADVTVQITTSAWRHRPQRELNAALSDAGSAPLVVVSTAEPYDAAHTQGQVQLAAYDRGAAAMAATAEVLLGAPAPGELPVPVGAHPIGAGGALAACA